MLRSMKKFLSFFAKPEPIGFIALIISIINSIYIFRGPDIEMFSPSQVVIFFSEKENNNLQIGARLAYINYASQNTVGSIESEYVVVKIGNKSFTLKSINVRSFINDGERLISNIEGDAKPFAIRGGEVVSREISFSAFPEVCAKNNPDCDAAKNFIDRIDALNSLASLARSNNFLELQFFGKSPDQRAVSTICKSFLSMDDAKRLSVFNAISISCIQ